MKIGPDGAIWFIDWHNPIIGHLQHAIRDPNRDRTHGRIYRVTYEGRELTKTPQIEGAPITNLLDLLKEPQGQWLNWRTKYTGLSIPVQLSSLEIELPTI